MLEHTVSKSIDVNLNSLRKKGGTRIVLRRWEDDMAQTLLQEMLSLVAMLLCLHILQ